MADTYFALVKDGVVIDRTIGSPVNVRDGIQVIQIVDPADGFIGQQYNESGFVKLVVPEADIEYLRMWRRAELAIAMKAALKNGVPTAFQQYGASMSDEYMQSLELALKTDGDEVHITSPEHVVVTIPKDVAITMRNALGKARSTILQGYATALLAVKSAQTKAQITAVEV